MHLAAEWKLGRGEVESILLAEQVTQPFLVDDGRAAACALARGVRVVRTTTPYVFAKERGWITTVRPKLDALRASGFHLAERDYRAVLSAAGECNE